MGCDTESEGVVSDEVMELVVKDSKQGEGGSRIYKWKHERPLYLELLKIAQQMVAGASWPNTPLSFQAGGIDRQGAVQKASRSLSPTVAAGGGPGVGWWDTDGGWCGEKRSRLKWSGAELELFFALLD